MKKNSNLDFFLWKKSEKLIIFLDKKNLINFFLNSFKTYFKNKIKIKNIVYFEVNAKSLSLIFSLKSKDNFLAFWEDLKSFFETELQKNFALSLKKFGFLILSE